ncbi:hypothetical protein Bpfe_005230 [Biomphalaria pfeifferi]|uniref:Uncharacterized protein n=1 Tax=Biomphalaria pfeifferi TaxID=112525 RepID=A0AAD8C2E0_BIOPF|nr:hypothetical protein Bpfe_005230 [Biomphalaria pfeifferi]
MAIQIAPVCCAIERWSYLLIGAWFRFHSSSFPTPRSRVKEVRPNEILISMYLSLRETLLPRMRPSPTSLYGFIIQAPRTSHLIASYIRVGVFCCLKVDPSRSPHIPVEGESLITLDQN